VDSHYNGSHEDRRSGRPTPLFYRHKAHCQTRREPSFRPALLEFVSRLAPKQVSFDPFVPSAAESFRQPERYSSFAFIVIFAFNTFDTGHPFSAASAYF